MLLYRIQGKTMFLVRWHYHFIYRSGFEALTATKRHDVFSDDK